MGRAGDALQTVAASDLQGSLRGLPTDWATLFPFAAFLVFLLIHEVPNERSARELVARDFAPLHRAGLYGLVAFLILSSGGGFSAPFIYFQF